MTVQGDLASGFTTCPFDTSSWLNATRLISTRSRDTFYFPVSWRRMTCPPICLCASACHFIFSSAMALTDDKEKLSTMEEVGYSGQMVTCCLIFLQSTALIFLTSRFS